MIFHVLCTFDIIHIINPKEMGGGGGYGFTEGMLFVKNTVWVMFYIFIAQAIHFSCASINMHSYTVLRSLNEYVTPPPGSALRTPHRPNSYLVPSGSRTRDSHAGGGRSNKERQRLQPLASVARAPFLRSGEWGLHWHNGHTHPLQIHFWTDRVSQCGTDHSDISVNGCIAQCWKHIQIEMISRAQIITHWIVCQIPCPVHFICLPNQTSSLVVAVSTSELMSGIRCVR